MFEKVSRLLKYDSNLIFTSVLIFLYALDPNSSDVQSKDEHVQWRWPETSENFTAEDFQEFQRDQENQNIAQRRILSMKSKEKDEICFKEQTKILIY